MSRTGEKVTRNVLGVNLTFEFLKAKDPAPAHSVGAVHWFGHGGSENQLQKVIDDWEMGINKESWMKTYFMSKSPSGTYVMTVGEQLNYDCVLIYRSKMDAKNEWGEVCP